MKNNKSVKRMNFHLAVGTPMYGGMCTNEYTQSLLTLAEGIYKSDNKMTTIFLGNESLIQRGRNTIVYHFLNTTATHLLFIDADIGFRSQDIAKMIASDKELIIGPVPMKGIDWEQVRYAVLAGKQDIYSHTGIFNITHLSNSIMVSENEPFEIKHGGGAFMLIKREVFESLIPYTPYYTNGGVSISPSSNVYNFFRVEIIPGTQELLSEDYFFCESYRNIGGKVYCAPWCNNRHSGTYIFNGNYIKKFELNK